MKQLIILISFSFITHISKAQMEVHIFSDNANDFFINTVTFFTMPDGTCDYYKTTGENLSENVKSCSEAKIYADSVGYYFKRSSKQLSRNKLSENREKATVMASKTAEIYNKNCNKVDLKTNSNRIKIYEKLPLGIGIYKTKEDFLTNKFEEYPSAKKVKISKSELVIDGKKFDFSSDNFGFCIYGQLYFFENQKKSFTNILVV